MLTIPSGARRGEQAVHELERGHRGIRVEEALHGRHGDVRPPLSRREAVDELLQRVVVAAPGGSEADERRLVPPCLEKPLAPLRTP